MKHLAKQVFARPTLTRLAAARLSHSVLVLAYHDVAPDTGPGSWMRVRQTEFDRQLRWLGELGQFVTPDQLPVEAEDSAQGHRTIRGHGRSAPDGDGCTTTRQRGLRFLLTFDDGHINNHRLALPIMKRYGAPALFFLSTWHTATGEPFWFDRVVLPIQVAGTTELDLRELGLHYYRFLAQDGPERWNGIDRLLTDIKGLGNPGQTRVERILKRCEDLAGERGRAALADCGPLRIDEICAMRASGLCHFGSHAHGHEILTRLGDAELATSLSASYAFLSEILQVAPLDLAYPNGDADERVLAATRAAGFRRGYTTAPGVVRRQMNPLRLPRLMIGGYDTPAVLAFKLNRVLMRAALQ